MHCSCAVVGSQSAGVGGVGERGRDLILCERAGFEVAGETPGGIVQAAAVAGVVAVVERFFGVDGGVDGRLAGGGVVDRGGREVSQAGVEPLTADAVERSLEMIWAKSYPYAPVD